MAYKSKYHKIQELVDKTTFDARGELAWELMDEQALRGLDATHDVVAKEYGVNVADVVVTINNWHSAKPGEYVYSESGLRNPSTSTGSPFSQHKLAKAWDLKIRVLLKGAWKVLTGDEMRVIFRKYQVQIGCTCIELGTNTWGHQDYRNCTPLKEVPFK